MNWLTTFEEDMNAVFREAEAILARYPESFNQPALDYLDKFHVLKDDRSKNYICYLLPFWLQELTDVDLTNCRNIAVANVFGMLYYHLVDEVMDDPNAKVKRNLTLANFIHFEFVHIYNTYFPASSPFWTYFRKYTAEWAEAVTKENQRDFFQENRVQIAHKASPVKLTIIATLMLAHQEDLIPSLEHAVDTVLITIQMLDDWKDWEKDLEEGSYNSLISTVQLELNIPTNRRPTADEINRGIYVEDVLLRFAEKGNKNHVDLDYIKSSIPHLYHFHESLRLNLEESAQQIQTERNLLKQGGLHFLLSKIKK